MTAIESQRLAYHSPDGGATSYSTAGHAPVFLDAKKTMDFCITNHRMHRDLGRSLKASRYPHVVELVYEALVADEFASLLDLRAKLHLPTGPLDATGDGRIGRRVPCADRVANWADLMASSHLNRTLWRYMCDNGNLIPPDAKLSGKDKESFHRARVPNGRAAGPLETPRATWPL